MLSISALLKWLHNGRQLGHWKYIFLNSQILVVDFIASIRIYASLYCISTTVNHIIPKTCMMRLNTIKR